jgi:hypothetical protein
LGKNYTPSLLVPRGHVFPCNLSCTAFLIDGLGQEAVSMLKNKLLSRMDGSGNQVEALPGIRTGSAQPGTVVSPNSEQGRIVPSIKHSDSEVVLSDLAFFLLLMLASWLDRALCGTFSGLDSYSSEAIVGCLGLAYAILTRWRDCKLKMRSFAL